MRHFDSQRLAALPRQIGEAGRYMAQTLRLMVGVPDYGAYVAHMAQAHPGEPVMSYEAFFEERQQARYGRRTGGRCC